MAIYSGLTYDDIINSAITIAKSHGVELKYSEAIGFIDEALMQVAIDTIEEDAVFTQAWGDATITGMKGVYPYKVFGDSVELVYIDYAKYRRMFLGSTANKPDSDDNVYYTILGDDILLEPNVTGFTNVIILFAPYVTQYKDRATVSDTPELRKEYRILASYRMLSLIFPSVFRNVYRDELKNKVRFRNRKLKPTGVQFWDPFQGTDQSRK